MRLARWESPCFRPASRECQTGICPSGGLSLNAHSTPWIISLTADFAVGSTLIAAFALYWGVIEFFHAFGVFLIFTITFALLFAVVFFVTVRQIRALYIIVIGRSRNMHVQTELSCGLYLSVLILVRVLVY
jgi:hypothetical protein